MKVVKFELGSLIEIVELVSDINKKLKELLEEIEKLEAILKTEGDDLAETIVSELLRPIKEKIENYNNNLGCGKNQIIFQVRSKYLNDNLVEKLKSKWPELCEAKRIFKHCKNGFSDYVIYFFSKYVEENFKGYFKIEAKLPQSEIEKFKIFNTYLSSQWRRILPFDSFYLLNQPTNQKGGKDEYKRY